MATALALVTLASTVAGWFITIGKARQQLNGLGRRTKAVEESWAHLFARVERLEQSTATIAAEQLAGARERGQLQNAVSSCTAQLAGLVTTEHDREIAIRERITAAETKLELLLRARGDNAGGAGQ